MAILVSVLWVAIGIVYIIYKCFSEKTKATMTVLSAIGIFLALFLIPTLIINYIANETDGLGLIPAICVASIPLILAAVVIIYIINKIDNRNAQRQTPEAKEKRKDEISRLFIQEGYRISTTMLERLVEDFSSPIHDSDRLSVSIKECFDWLCLQRELELESQNEVEFDKTLGVPLKNIPLNQNKELGAAVLQRKALAMKYIMEKDGLRLTDFYRQRSWVNDSSDYPDKFIQYVTEHQ